MTAIKRHCPWCHGQVVGGWCDWCQVDVDAEPDE